MRPARDADGATVLVLERSDPAVVYDPGAGERRAVPATDLDPVEGDPLAAAGSALAADLALADAALGVLADLAASPRPVRGMLDAYGRCESDLHGLLAELQAAGLVEETEVGGERGYRLTEDARAALP
ncbi:MAG: hypothetical protein ABEH77_05805 [Halobacteriaceae archaeon]